MTFDEIKQLTSKPHKKFSEIARDKLPMPGRKVRIDDILNKDIEIVDFRVRKSTKRENTECLQLQFVYNNEVCILFTGSVVLLDQIQSVKEEFPVDTKIVKIDKYYAFS